MESRPVRARASDTSIGPCSEAAGTSCTHRAPRSKGEPITSMSWLGERTRQLAIIRRRESSEPSVVNRGFASSGSRRRWTSRIRKRQRGGPKKTGRAPAFTRGRADPKRR